MGCAFALLCYPSVVVGLVARVLYWLLLDFQCLFQSPIDQQPLIIGRDRSASLCVAAGYCPRCGSTDGGVNSMRSRRLEGTVEIMGLIDEVFDSVNYNSL